ncbi:hypothetical protein [Methanosarcina sp. WWM596]|uniref:hypothetical protein n=1 Tax=Methanosarcina sp. WWM596 TaxID=1434103 RepID=UPI001E30A4A4|nr:hypothetical protein [Methanosarcina sp. WWM596]
MKNAVFMVPKPSLVQEAVGIIDELDISGQSSESPSKNPRTHRALHPFHDRRCRHCR